MVIAKATVVSRKKSGGHWYDAEGKPCHTQPNQSKPGERRPTTIRDARLLGLYPSVTSITKLLKSDGLDYWSEGVVIEQCYHNNPSIEESIDDYSERIRKLVIAEKAIAPDRGTEIHKSIELSLTGKPYNDEHKPHVQSVTKWLSDNGIACLHNEKTIIPGKCGYGGTVDFIGDQGDRLCIVDFKTKDTKDREIKQYDEQKLQLVAYKWGLGHEDVKFTKSDLYNLYVSRDEPGFVHAIQVPKEEEGDLLERFLLLHKYWQLKNKLTLNKEGVI